MPSKWYEKPIGTYLPNRGPRLRANYQLTTLGQTKAENLGISGAKGEIVTALENVGPCTISELANETKMSQNRVKQIMEVLVRDGWATKVSGDK